MEQTKQENIKSKMQPGNFELKTESHSPAQLNCPWPTERPQSNWRLGIVHHSMSSSNVITWKGDC